MKLTSRFAHQFARQFVHQVVHQIYHQRPPKVLPMWTFHFGFFTMVSVYSLSISAQSLMPNSRVPNSITAGSNIFEKSLTADGCDSSIVLPRETRERAMRAAGQDIVQFAEATAMAFHLASTDEMKLKIIAESFDHETWSESLTQAATFLNLYNRVMENSRRQEESALRAYSWSKEQRSFLTNHPLDVRVSNLRSMECMKNEKDEYGCKRGETVWLVKLLVSPMIACRFPEKLDAYSVQYWVRMTPQGPRVIEIQANRSQLVKTAKESLESRKILVQGVTPTAARAASIASLEGLNLDRMTALWRKWLKARGVASHPERIR